MEYSNNGDLLKYVKTNGKIPEEKARYFFQNIAIGLSHIHCRSVLHWDIKLDNVLLDTEGGVKLCDFGVSKIMKKDQVIKEQCGTPAYIAPEIISEEGYSGYGVDLWSLGVLLYAMLCGTVPFKATNMKDLHLLINKGDFSFPNPISEEAQNLIRKMLTKEPLEWISLPEVLSHPWMTKMSEDDFDETDLQTDVQLSWKKCAVMTDD